MLGNKKILRLLSGSDRAAGLSGGVLRAGLLAWLVLCAAAVAEPPRPGRYQSYPIRHKQAAQVMAMLSDLLADAEMQADLIVDARTNQVLVRGPEDVQRVVEKLIEQVDRPVPATPAEGSQPVLRSYACARDRLAKTADRLRTDYANDQRLSVATDPSTGLLLILAAPELQRRIATDLAQLQPAIRAVANGTTESSAPRAAPRPRLTPTPVPARQGMAAPRTVHPKYARVPQIETRLKELLTGRLRSRTPVVPGRAEYLLLAAGGKRLEWIFDRRGNHVTLLGDAELAGQAERLLHALDSPPPAVGQTLRIVPLINTAPIKVEEAARAYRRRSSDDATQPPTTRGTGPVLPPATDRAGDRSSRGKTPRIPLVSYLFQSPDEGQGAGVPDEERGAEQQGAGGLRVIGPDVAIEVFPDLDVIILRGANRDVEELTRIIEELERISAENEPQIEIYLLKHVKDEALATLIATVQDELLAGRQGRVSITPLVKPDALLLIGWGDALKAAKDLIEKLDRPVAPDSQLKVFRLRSAPALTVQTTINQFLASQTGLGTRVTVAPDIRSNALIVRAAPRDMAEIELLVKQLDTPASEAVTQVRIFYLKNSLATDLSVILRQAALQAGGQAGGGGKSAVLELLSVDRQGARILKSGILSDVGVTPNPQTNSLVITAPAQSMSLIKALIERLDEAPGSVAQIKVFRVSNGDANSLVDMLRSLLPEKTAAAVGPQIGGADEEASFIPLRLSVDARTNAIIATGSAGDLKIIEALLIRLDEKDVQVRKNSVYRLLNAPAVDVSNAINQFLRSERQIEQAPPGAISPFLQIEREVVIVPETVSNSVIISATPRYYEDIMDLIKELDKEPPQVMIQVLIAEVALNDTDEFGVELGLQDGLLFDRGLLGELVTTTNTLTQSTQNGIVTDTNEIIQAASLLPGFDFNNQTLGNSGSDKSVSTAGQVAGQGLTNFSLGRVNKELNYGGLVLSASSASVSLLVRALQESRRLEILARPHVMTLDNQPAYIQVGQRVPRIVSSSVTQIGQINQVTLENVGLILGVTPRISPTGTVVMEIDTEQSKVGPEAEGIPVSISASGEVVRSPRIDTRTAQTTVAAANGETIVLGGLITKMTEGTHRRVPFLSDIPVLGHLFRYDAERMMRTELLIIMTPHVILTPGDAQKIRHIEECRMSWTACDVQQLHGMNGICAQDNCPTCRKETEVIYPDLNPSGVMPEQLPTDLPEDLPHPASGLITPPATGSVEPISFQASPALATTQGGAASATTSHASATETGKSPYAKVQLRSAATWLPLSAQQAADRSNPQSATRRAPAGPPARTRHQSQSDNSRILSLTPWPIE